MPLPVICAALKAWHSAALRAIETLPLPGAAAGGGGPPPSGNLLTLAGATLTLGGANLTLG